MIQNIRDVKECPDCASTNLVYMDEQDQVVCQDCQLVFEPLAPSDEERYESVHNFNPRERIIARSAPVAAQVIARKMPKLSSPKKVVKKKVAKKPKRPAKKKAVKKKTVKGAKKKIVTQKGKKRR